MSVNFAKNHEEIQSAWKDILNDKTSTNWALFSYEKQSNDLCLVGKGDGGLDELAEEFNSARLMYGLARVTDPNTGLPKFVLINWQGEGAPLTRKGMCSNHITDVAKYFKGANIHVNARSEDDVEASFIMEKVAKVASSKFDFSTRSEVVENMAPVGSVYKRTQPIREINSSERQKFWQKQAEEEESRVKLERQKVDEEKALLEKERKQRETQEALEREKQFLEKSQSITKLREATKNAENTAKNREREDWRRQMQENAQDEVERKQRSETLKKERKNEAEALISTRTINARAIFEQNTSFGQMSDLKGQCQTPLNNLLDSPPTPVATASPQIDLPLGDIPEERTWDDPEEEARYLREKLASSPLLVAAAEGLKARALYDYQAADETEISFDPDDIITQIDQIDDGWWQGMAPDGSFGLFPANYVELVK